MGLFDDMFGNYGDLFNEVFAMKEWQDRLDKLYWTDAKTYLRVLNDIKSKGYKVLRNSKGEHRIEIKY